MLKAVLIDKRRALQYVPLIEKEFEPTPFTFVAEDVIDGDEADIVRAAKDADLILNVYTTMPRSVIEQLDNCKAIVRTGVGWDMVDTDACDEKGIKVLNVPDYCFPEVASHAMALLLSLERNITYYKAHTPDGIWNIKSAYPMNRLSALTLGVVGFGSIGRLFTEYAKPFGFDIVAYDPYVKQEVFDEYGVKSVSLDELFRISDAISLHTPITDETYHMVNAETLKTMKPNAIIINVSRGGLIDTEALVDAVNNGEIYGAGLDVLESEPNVDTSHRVFHTENIVITPHAAYASNQASPELFTRAARSIINAYDDSGPYSLVNNPAKK